MSNTNMAHPTGRFAGRGLLTSGPEARCSARSGA